MLKNRCELLISTQLLAIALLLASSLTACDKLAQSNNKSEHSNRAFLSKVYMSEKPSIRIDGSKFRNERNEVIQLRGVSLMGMEYTAILGFNSNDPFDTVTETTWSALKTWGINAIRIPLNETSYLGIRCVSAFTGPAYNKPGKIQQSDPGNNYKTRLREVIDRATEEGLYVILDLHMSAPADAENKVDEITDQCATAANPLPDADHAIAFWTEVASTYKTYPNVLFEVFNNPYIDQWLYFAGNKTAAWKALRDGTVVNYYMPLLPTPKSHLWQSAGIQGIIDAVRRTGATNIVLQSGLSRSSDLELWLTYKAIDPISQTAVAWHAFPNKESEWGSACYSYPGPWCDDRSYKFAATILNAKIPVVVTEFGDKNNDGTVGAPFASSLLPQLDGLGISYFAWTFAVGKMLNNQLVKDNVGTPTDGYGEYVFAHYQCRAKGNVACPDSQISAAKLIHPTPAQPSHPPIHGWMPLVSPL
jgi:endoglucanase